MKKTILSAALITAFAFPAHANDGSLLAQNDDARAKAAEERNRAAEERNRAAEERNKARAEAAEARAKARSEANEARAKARAEADRVMKDTEHIRIDAHEMGDWARDFAASMQDSMTFMFTDRAGRGKVVKGAPYSADVVTETNQALTDGNIITHRNVNKVWRDGEGRTRQESYRSEKLRSIYISDPVAGMAYTVLPGSKIAVAIPRMEFTHVHTAPRARTESSSRSSTSTETTTSSDGKRVVVRTVTNDGGPGVREEVRVQVIRAGDDANIMIAPTPPTPATPATPPTPAIAPIAPIPPLAMIPGVHTMRFENMGHLGKGTTASLGTKSIEGVKAEGKSTTWTIAAGQIGNKAPIVVTSESWYSPELQVTVYSRYNDPRTGESLYRLAGLKRAEPQADLFKVPEGYSIKGKGGKEKAPKAKNEKE